MNQHPIPHLWWTFLSEETSIDLRKISDPVTHEVKETLERRFPYGRIIAAPDNDAPDRKFSCWSSIEFEMCSFQGSQEVLLVENLLGHNLIDFAQVICRNRHGQVENNPDLSTLRYNAVWRTKCSDARAADYTSSRRLQ